MDYQLQTLTIAQHPSHNFFFTEIAVSLAPKWVYLKYLVFVSNIKVLTYINITSVLRAVTQIYKSVFWLKPSRLKTK